MELYLDDNLFSGTEEEFLTVKKFFCKNWKLNKRLHRIDGPAVIYSDGSEQWHQNGKFHRVDGPAVTRSNGYQAWCQNGNLHRTDGPAIIYSNGYQEYGINGHNLTIFFPMHYWFNNSCAT